MLASFCLALAPLGAFLAEGEGEMKDGPPKQWTEAEARRLKTLIRQKVNAESITTGITTTTTITVLVR
jgi:hypothetical protein